MSIKVERKHLLTLTSYMYKRKDFYKMEKIILFDLDGTLMNTKEGITRCAAYALEHYGIQEEPDHLDFFIGPPLHVSFQEFYGFDSEKAAEAARIYRERYKDIGVFECEPYAGISDVLRQLKEDGFQLGVATSKPEVFAVRILEKFEFIGYFNFVTGSLLDNTRSDKKEVIEEALRRFEVPEDRICDVLMVGDRKHDIIGAKQTGLSSMGVKFGFAKENELEESGADYIAELPADIVRLAREWREH